MYHTSYLVDAVTSIIIIEDHVVGCQSISELLRFRQVVWPAVNSGFQIRSVCSTLVADFAIWIFRKMLETIVLWCNKFFA